MFFAITGAIVSGAGAVIVGGLYWSRGTTLAAWVAMTIGWVMAIGRILLQQLEPRFAAVTDRGALLRLVDSINATNSQWIWLWIMVACILSYVVVSLLTCRKPFEMDRLLHRGRYAVAGDHVKARDATRSLWWKITGITEEFTRADRWLAAALVIWNFGWFAVFLVGSLWNLTHDVPADAWAGFWQVWLWLHIGLGIPATVWFAIGGARDIKRLFAHLATAPRDARDDGRVIDAAKQREQTEPIEIGSANAPRNLP